MWTVRTPIDVLSYPTRRSSDLSLALTRCSTSPTLRSHFGRMTSWIGSLPSELEAGYAYCSTNPCSSDRGRGCRIGGFQRRLRPRAEARVERRGGREGGYGVRQVRQSQGVEDEHRGARRRWGAALLPARPGLLPGSVDISINKAWTATQFGFPTRLFGESIVKASDGIQYAPC